MRWEMALVGGALVGVGLRDWDWGGSKFATIDDPSTLVTRDTTGIENTTSESDYPHGDGTWPDTQLVIERCGDTSPTRSCA